jgi:hypothetical protein
VKLLAGLVASIALFGGVQVLHGGNSRDVVADAAPSSSFRLTANGNEAACAVHRGAEVSDGLSLLTVAPNCRKLMPGIEHAKFWREQADGTVAFSENGIDPIVTFAVVRRRRLRILRTGHAASGSEQRLRSGWRPIPLPRGRQTSPPRAGALHRRRPGRSWPRRCPTSPNIRGATERRPRRRVHP